MNVEELELDFRYRFADQNSKKYQLSPEMYLAYLNQAIDEACVRSDLINDRTSSICTKAISANVAAYELDESIYAITHAYFYETGSTDYTELKVKTPRELDAIRPTWRTDSADSPPRFLIFNPHSHIAELVCTPSIAGTLKLEVYRTPIDKLRSSKQSPEIAKIFHRDLNWWVLAIVYNLPDENALNPTKAREAQIEFERVFGAKPQADDFEDKYSDEPHRVRASFI